MKVPLMPFKHFLRSVEPGRALEIGGPSGTWPYPMLAPRGVDGLNHQKTIWQGTNVDNSSYLGIGVQHIGDALTPPDVVKGGKYRLLLASHVLEHIANPLKALKVWQTLVAPGGHICLILPKKEHTFDHKRPITSFEALNDKFERDVGEDDLSSLPEILALHDLALDPPAGTPEEFKARSLKNFENRCLHHHVFDIDLLIRIGIAMGFQIEMCHVEGMHQYIVYKTPQQPAGRKIVPALHFS